MEIDLIVAVDKNGGIGLNGDIPWKNTPYGREDMTYFKKVTAGRTVIMGRRTYESIPAKFRPLPGRLNIVLSSSYQNETGSSVVPREIHMNSFDAAIDWCQNAGILNPMVCGGVSVYTAALKHPNFGAAYVTLVPYDGPSDVNLDDRSIWSKLRGVQCYDSNTGNIFKKFTPVEEDTTDDGAASATTD